MKDKNTRNVIIAGILGGVVATIITFLILNFVYKNPQVYGNVADWFGAAGTVVAVIVSLCLARRNERKVIFKPNFEVVMGGPDNNIDKLSYRIYGFNSGNFSDAVKSFTIFSSYAGCKVKLFSIDTQINLNSGNYLDIKKNHINCSDVHQYLYPFLIKSQTEVTEVQVELEMYSGKKYEDTVEVTVKAVPKWGVEQVSGQYSIRKADSSTFVSKDDLKSNKYKSKFESSENGAYTAFTKKEDAQEVFEQYKKEELEKY